MKAEAKEKVVNPGCLVYVVIEPSTRPHDKGYRPYQHFVLETEVRSVFLRADGEVHYTFATPFVVEDFLLSKEGAMEYLSSFFEPGTLDQVPYVSREEEAGNRLDDDLPF